jgi:hypothetical protein
VPSAVAAESDPYPMLVTAETRANPETLAALQRPGKVIFSDGFESSESLKKYFEIRGLREGRAKLITDAKLAHSGRGAIQFAADYDQGNLNHVGGGLAAVAGTDRYRAMGSAGIRPRGGISTRRFWKKRKHRSRPPQRVAKTATRNRKPPKRRFGS